MSTSLATSHQVRRSTDVLTRLDSLLQRDDASPAEGASSPAAGGSASNAEGIGGGRKSSNSGADDSPSKLNGTAIISPPSSASTSSPMTAKTNSVSHRRNDGYAASSTASSSSSGKGEAARRKKPSGILKKRAPSNDAFPTVRPGNHHNNGRRNQNLATHPRNKRSIRFPDDGEEMQEIIGYGGGAEELLSSEDDDDEEEVMLSVSLRLKQLQNKGRRRRSNSSSDDEGNISLEERNMINLTKRNTDFNARSSNFMLDANGQVCGPLKLGSERKASTAAGPLVTVSPFGAGSSQPKAAKVNKVSPMVNGQLLVRKVEEEMVLGGKAKQADRKVGDMQEISQAKMEPNAVANGGANKEVTTRFDSGGDDVVGENKRSNDNVEEVGQIASSSSSSSEAVGSDPSSAWKKKSRGADRATLSTIESDDGDDDDDGGGEAAAAGKIGSAKVEESLASSDNKSKPHHVKLTRKSPYVTSSILKGTPKPVIKVKSKPPVPTNKPKIPEKPKNLKTSSSSSSASSAAVVAAPKSPPNWGKNPVATPRKGSFRNRSAANEEQQSSKGSKEDSDDTKTKAGDVRISSSDSSLIDLSKLKVTNPNAIAESYNSEADAQNEVIFEVNATMVTKKQQASPSMPVKSEREEVLEKIRKSLESKQEEMKSDNHAGKSAVGFSSNLPCRSSSTKRQAPKPPPQTSNNGGGETKPSTGGGDSQGEGKSEHQRGNSSSSSVSSPPPASSSSSSPPPSSASSGGKMMTRHSSLRPSNGEKKSEGSGHRVQFSLEHEDLEETRRRKVREAAEATDPNPISYNQWITRGALNGVVARQPVNGIVESSFTGQPIQVMPPAAQQQQGGDVVAVKSPVSPTPLPASKTSAAAANGAPKVIPLQQKPMSPADDEVRRWTEKKRSRSQQPRGSEIEELRGSSKAKPKSRFFPSVQLPLTSSNSNSSNGPAIKRHSRVELYENERKQKGHNSASNSGSRFFGKIIRQLAQTSQRIGGSHGELYSSPGKGPSSSSGFLDEEHEREIIERDRSKRHLAGLGLGPPRPSIVHPVELTGAVEVVPIRPHAGSTHRGHFAKNSRAAGLRKGAAPVVVAAAAGGSAQQALATSVGPQPAVVTKSILKARVEYSDSKDSGHETSSIHTDNSDNSSGCETSSGSATMHATSSSEQYGMATEHGQLGSNDFEQQQHLKHQQLQHQRQSSSSPLRPQPNLNAGKVKPAPPPRSSSNSQLGSSSNSSSCGSDVAPSTSSSSSSGDRALESLVPERPNLASINSGGRGHPFASSPVVAPVAPSAADGPSSGPPSGPPNGYVLAGQMNLGGAIRVPAFNSANLRTSRLFAKEQGEADGGEDERKKHNAATSPPPPPPTPAQHINKDDGDGSGRQENIGGTPSAPSAALASSPEIGGGATNYDTVTSANLEVLTQILAEATRDHGDVDADRLSAALRAGTTPLRLSDFQLQEETAAAGGALRNATFGRDRIPVTLAILTGPSDAAAGRDAEESPLSLRRAALPLARFDEDAGGDVGGGYGASTEVTVFPRLGAVSGLFARRARGESREGWISPDEDEGKEPALTQRDALLVILQLLKGSSGRATMTRKTMGDYILIRAERGGGGGVLAKLQGMRGPKEGEEEQGDEELSISQFALLAMMELTGHSSREELLARSSVREAEIVRMMMEGDAPVGAMIEAVELALWGPSNVSLAEELQRWLDLERAAALNEVLRKGGLRRVRLTLLEELRMAFLVAARAGRIAQLLANSGIVDGEAAATKDSNL